VAVSKGELFTIVTNKAAHGKKGAIVAVAAGTRASDVSKVLKKIPAEKRRAVKEVTLDLSPAMKAIVRKSFPIATVVDDRFHVQQLVSEAAQDSRMIMRRETLKEAHTQYMVLTK